MNFNVNNNIFQKWYTAYVNCLPDEDETLEKADTADQQEQMLKNHVRILDALTKQGMPTEIRKRLDHYMYFSITGNHRRIA